MMRAEIAFALLLSFFFLFISNSATIIEQIYIYSVPTARTTLSRIMTHKVRAAHRREKMCTTNTRVHMVAYVCFVCLYAVYNFLLGLCNTNLPLLCSFRAFTTPYEASFWYRVECLC